ncbi:MAG: SDR family NAD(P)-dependent oxidoreductase [Rhodoplanes sp.]|uniref:SDR family oxidoreductase n=1 Tax=Rhodoplanes sp. TaxID=1968906 RepID=UPI0017D70F6E|nr:SDR family NAD(P)-dependent oxidoreductase [Rhodoplanes sp.]NVO13741.1 SDR family NAD(P)-dependent oxidoreductase [Rhodoplanes sp.]
MQMSGNTILITGGGTGIGRGLAEAFHALGNRVIVAGRRQAALDMTTAANPGMASITLDIEDPAAIKAFAAEVTAQHPDLDIVINNAGMMKIEDILAQPEDVGTAEATVVTNLLGPIRLTAALLPFLMKKPRATVMTVSSGLAFVPRASTPSYSATKAAIHSYTQSLRFQLRTTAVEVIEIVPPYVQTELMGPQQAIDPAAMPLADFIAETMALLATGAQEICVERVKPLRFAEARGDYDTLFKTRNEPRIPEPAR